MTHQSPGLKGRKALVALMTSAALLTALTFCLLYFSGHGIGIIEALATAILAIGGFLLLLPVAMFVYLLLWQYVVFPVLAFPILLFTGRRRRRAPTRTTPIESAGRDPGE